LAHEMVDDATIRVLLVEDNPGDAGLIREELRGAEHGGAAPTAFAIVCADRLAAGLERLAGDKIDVVLLDLSLPDAHGLGSLARVRAAAPTTPVLVLTGFDDQELAARAVREGAQDYLVKGQVEGEVLGRTIRYAIERGRLLASERVARAEAEAARQRAEEANLELVRLAAEAETANRAKSTFLATMSHELRTPLNAIAGYTQLLEMGLHGPVTESQRDALHRIHVNHGWLVSLVTEILDYAKLESGQLRLDLRDLVVSELLEGLETAVGPQVRVKGLYFHCCPGCDGKLVRADRERARQIVLNLVSNAIKFTDRGGVIRVSCDERDGRIATHVEDTGRGIPPDKLEKIFEPFVQLEQGFTRSAGGAGLGLAISRDLARAMRGDLLVESVPGRGSVFTLWLPAAHGTESAPRTAAAAGATPEPTARGGEGYSAAAMVEIARYVAREADQIVYGLAWRLREDPLTPQARAVSTLELTDHIETLLTDVAKSLSLVAEMGGEPSQILRDGTEVQRLLSERHGAQRARLGWTETAHAREFEILRDEVATSVRGGAAAVPLRTSDVDMALALLRGFIEHAEHASLRGMRLAVVAGRT
jgi:signal transduction histidine kinase